MLSEVDFGQIKFGTSHECDGGAEWRWCPSNQCRFMCNDKWSDRLNDLVHNLQRNGLMPVCLRKCRVNSSDRAKRHSHPSHVHTYGFSPMKKEKIASKLREKQTKKNTEKKNGQLALAVWNGVFVCVRVRMCVSAYFNANYQPVCVRLCAFKWELFVYTLLQPITSQRWFLRLVLSSRLFADVTRAMGCGQSRELAPLLPPTLPNRLLHAMPSIVDGYAIVLDAHNASLALDAATVGWMNCCLMKRECKLPYCWMPTPYVSKRFTYVLCCRDRRGDNAPVHCCWPSLTCLLLLSLLSYLKLLPTFVWIDAMADAKPLPVPPKFDVVVRRWQPFSLLMFRTVEIFSGTFWYWSLRSREKIGQNWYDAITVLSFYRSNFDATRTHQ